MSTYGLHPTLWRKLRKIIWGGEVPVYNKHGAMIGEMTLFRYESLISTDVAFTDIHWGETIKRARPSRCGVLTGDTIEIGIKTYM